MRLVIENVAKVKKADIEINGITVVAGENKTGKSTIGKVLYSLFTSFYNINEEVRRSRKNSIHRLYDVLGYFDEESEEYVSFRELNTDFNKLYSDLSRVDFKNSSKEVVEDVFKSIIMENNNNHQEISNLDEIVSEMYRIMILEEEDIRKTIVLQGFNREFNRQLKPLYDFNGNSSISLYIKNDLIELEFVDSLKSDSLKIKKYIEILKEPLYIDDPKALDEVELKQSRKYLIFNSASNIHSSILASKMSHSKKNDLIEETLYSEKITRIKDIINDIIQGDFVTEDSKLMFKEKGLTGTLNLLNLSTGVKSFATLLRLLENGYIKDNGFLILDEPEVNLHPSWQIKYAELLAALQNEFGLHILLASHSPYFINAIQVFSAKYEIADKCKYYLSEIDEEERAYFKDVTKHSDEIYKKLVAPFQILENISSGLEYDD